MFSSAYMIFLICVIKSKILKLCVLTKIEVTQKISKTNQSLNIIAYRTTKRKLFKKIVLGSGVQITFRLSSRTPLGFLKHHVQNKWSNNERNILKTRSDWLILFYAKKMFYFLNIFIIISNFVTTKFFKYRKENFLNVWDDYLKKYSRK